MSNQINTELMERARDTIKNEYGDTLDERTEINMVDAEYRMLLMLEPTSPEELMDDDSGEEEEWLKTTPQPTCLLT